jgi:hypothetical protein
MFASNIKKKTHDVLDGLFSFFTKYEKKKFHNMLNLMLNPRFKSLKLVSFFIGQKQIVSMVKDYERQSLFLECC